MLETKEFKFVRNILWPFKSTLEISDAGINNKGKLTRWEDIVDFSYGITSINGSGNYLFTYKDKSGKKSTISFVVAVTGSKKKKAMFQEIYDRMHQGFSEKHIAPKAKEMLDKIKAGGTIEVGKVAVTKDGLETKKGSIPWHEVTLTQLDNGQYRIASSQDKKKAISLNNQAGENRILAEAIQMNNAGGFGK